MRFTNNIDSLKRNAGESIDQIKQESVFVDKKNKPFSDNLNENDIIFLLKNNSTNDSIYCSYNYPWNFILVPYFVKQKQLYEGQRFVYNNSRWKCTEVTLLRKSQVDLNSKDNTYAIYYVLKEDNGLENILDNPIGLVAENLYIKSEQEKKLQATELAAKTKSGKKKPRIEKFKERRRKYVELNASPDLDNNSGCSFMKGKCQLE